MSTLAVLHPGVPVMWHTHIRDLSPTAEAARGPHIQGNKVALVDLRPRIILRDPSVSSVVNQENKKETFIRVRTGVGQ